MGKLIDLINGQVLGKSSFMSKFLLMGLFLLMAPGPGPGPVAAPPAQFPHPFRSVLARPRRWVSGQASVIEVN